MKAYETYKDSGIEWIGEIPEHWKVKKVGYYLNFSRGLSITKQNLKDEGIACVNYGEIHSKYGFSVNPEIHSLKCVDEKYLETSERSLLKRGDFVFADTSEDIEGSGNFTCLDSDMPTFAGYHTIILRQNEIDYKYLAYYFDSLEYRNQIRSTVYGIKVYSITQAILKDSTFIHPPTKEEQTTIANYLDKKTAAIDQLIADKKRLIELYQEEKTAIINQAVTKGINPDVQLKDSGIEWLGDIPEYWEVYKLNGISSFVRGNSSFKKDELLKEGKYVALQYGKTYKVDEVDEDFEFYVNDEFYKDFQVVNNGDVIIISTSETIEDLGHSAFYNRMDLGLLGGEQIVLKPKSEKVDGKYLYYSSKGFTKELQKYARGIKVLRFNIDNLKTIYTSVPPKEEQIHIVQHIEKESARIDAKIIKAEKYIKLLTEYRTALISGVVTGKIKVV